MEEDEAMLLMMTIMQDNVVATEKVILPMVTGKNPEQRQLIYKFGMKQCIGGVQQGMK